MLLLPLLTAPLPGVCQQRMDTLSVMHVGRKQLLHEGSVARLPRQLHFALLRCNDGVSSARLDHLMPINTHAKSIFKDQPQKYLFLHVRRPKGGCCMHDLSARGNTCALYQHAPFRQARISYNQYEHQAGHTWLARPRTSARTPANCAQ